MNSVKSLGTYKKDELVRKEMCKLLQANPQGIGSEDFVKKIRETTGVSHGKVFSMIKKFVESDYMKIERGVDRRKAVYLPNLQKVKTEQRLSEGVEFARKLMSEPNIRFGEGETKSSGIRVRVSIFTNWNEETTGSLETQAKYTTGLFSSYYDKVLSKNMKIRPSVKTAFIITLET
ncbi:MAG TPA: hypothetical protein VMW36_08075 [Patescibacteria group bacterium]|nr:hypothetical protein [Patescibacteria group bacterium]